MYLSNIIIIFDARKAISRRGICHIIAHRLTICKIFDKFHVWPYFKTKGSIYALPNLRSRPPALRLALCGTLLGSIFQFWRLGNFFLDIVYRVHPDKQAFYFSPFYFHCVCAYHLKLLLFHFNHSNCQIGILIISVSEHSK